MAINTVGAGVMEPIAVAMNKKVIDQQGQNALALLQSSAQAAQAVQQAGASGAAGRNINVTA